MLIRRESYMRRIRPFIGNELVKVLTGIRRCGKSVMLKLIQEELEKSGVDRSHFISLNFEDMGNAGLRSASALHEEIRRRASAKAGKVYIFLDEIQEVEAWEKCIDSLQVSLECDIYITGSNARLLSGELATYLAGRYVEFVIYPFSFSEFCESYRSVFPDADVRECFNRYLVSGGMPYLVNLRFDEEAGRQYLRDLFSSVALKDVISRNNIREVDMLQRIITYLACNIGTVFSATGISKFIKSEGRKISSETVLNYIKACTDAFLFYQVRREDLQGKRILTVNEKYYIADHGLRAAVFGGNMKDIQLTLENIVFMELIRRGYSVTVGRYSEREIAFVCQRGGSRLYVQVCYLLASEETVEREFGSLLCIRDNFPKYVVSMDELDMGRDGIRHLNIRDFLLCDDWN